MWLSRFLLAIGIFALAACADTTIQRVGSMLEARDVGVHVVEVSGRIGQLYSRQLRDRFEGGGVSHDLSTRAQPVLELGGIGSRHRLAAEENDDDGGAHTYRPRHRRGCFEGYRFGNSDAWCGVSLFRTDAIRPSWCRKAGASLLRIVRRRGFIFTS